MHYLLWQELKFAISLVKANFAEMITNLNSESKAEELKLFEKND